MASPRQNRPAGTIEERLDLAIWALRQLAGIGGDRLGSSSTALVLHLVSGEPRTGDWPFDWGDAEGHVRTWTRLPEWSRIECRPMVETAVRRVNKTYPDMERARRLFAILASDPDATGKEAT